MEHKICNLKIKKGLISVVSWSLLDSCVLYLHVHHFYIYVIRV